ncbi:polyprenyl synthetase family protein [Sebaldella sp. S0638]|uniref:polyprenyl synthetase family protein n=1 Tax=Sebaldella sp. S0638 TaxID=2957809 RepID=UPI0020A1BE3D|nr:farnesyl diphosphate synthase [Sebaldella sp. S0638]MCP1223365.1 polyprenyl synthetase family protein [Sebaldella sp. S0638]
MLKIYLKEKREIFEKYLQEKMTELKYPERLSESMVYSVMNGGKRLRPVLMYMVADIFNADYSKIEDTAAALECIHSYSLVHDDLPAMDNDTYRRGKLTTHKQFDEATAILAGDALLTYAFYVISASEKIEDTRKVNIIRILSDYSGVNGMVGGQYVDMESEDKEISFDTLKYIHSHKTGKLLKAAVELPMTAIGVEGKQKEVLLEYSELIGIAFQIKDDLLDIEGDFEKMGKESSDEKNNKTTYPKLFGVEKTREILNDYTEKAKNLIRENFENAEILVELADYISNRGE